MGRTKFMRAAPFDAPSTPRPKGKNKPTVAGGGDPDLYKHAVTAVRDFRRRYRACRDMVKLCIDNKLDPRQVIFPFGTLLMSKRHGYACDDPQLDWCLRCPAPP